MSNPAFVDLDQVREKKMATNELIDNAAYVARNIPVACGIIYSLIEKLEADRRKEELFDGETEDFLFQLKYLIHAMQENTNKIHKCLIDTGHKDKLYYQD
ncbi:hypothetical protein [Commensalibacter nepenthis]|uniref:Uncharacterized protein n=1 Tax=Commensalibacter nepenthis TaxID=3043872 RepID=A0ABT6Q862_9PROT|nr:hypothetical protein [Commensalibacter sp. TBRC 10068]MDI2113074.1 hypothetical protein [Commensalibacter sp. TBRC 10068]